MEHVLTPLERLILVKMLAMVDLVEVLVDGEVVFQISLDLHWELEILHHLHHHKEIVVVLVDL